MGTPCRVLEVGSFEGIATCWIVDHVLSHPDARVTTIDPFTDATLQSTIIHSTTGKKQRRTFNANVARTKFPDKVTSFVGTSEEFYYARGDALKAERGTYDAIYVYGSHTSADTLLDAMSCWTLLKPGGIMIFDDYGKILRIV